MSQSESPDQVHHKRYVNKVRYLNLIGSSAANEQTEESVASPEFGSELRSWSILIIHQSRHLAPADGSDEVLQNHSSSSASLPHSLELLVGISDVCLVCGRRQRLLRRLDTQIPSQCVRTVFVCLQYFDLLVQNISLL